MTEGEDYGKHCEFQSCQQLSFLPLKCEGCGKFFCKNHNFRDNHNCSKSTRISPKCPICQQTIIVGLNEDLNFKVNQHIEMGCRVFKPFFDESKTVGNLCFFSGCKESANSPIVCPYCNQKFCPQHQLPEVHKCRHFTPAVTPSSSSSSSASSSFSSPSSFIADKVGGLFAKKKEGIKYTSNVAITQVKRMRALGNEKIEVTKRVYFDIILLDNDEKKAKTYYFQKDHPVGRCIDWLATKEKYINNNNIPGEKKLCLFLYPDEPLPMGIRMEEILADFEKNDILTLRLSYVNPQ